VLSSDLNIQGCGRLGYGKWLFYHLANLAQMNPFMGNDSQFSQS
jgi:hypothetical protein